MPPAIKKHIQKTQPRAEVLAIQALDEIVGDLIKANQCRVQPSFLDWVNLNATDFVLERLKKTASKDHLWATVHSENARNNMRHLVNAWVMPHVHQKFKALTWGDEIFTAREYSNSCSQNIDFVI